jgi:hypothetical protein
MASNVTTKPTTDRHTVRGGEREARLGKRRAGGAGVEGTDAVILNRAAHGGLAAQHASRLHEDGTRRARLVLRLAQGPSACYSCAECGVDHNQTCKECKTRVLVLPSGLGRALFPPQPSDDTPDRRCWDAAGGGPSLIVIPPAFLVLFLHCRNWPTVAHLWLALAVRPLVLQKQAIDELCEAVSSLRRAECRQEPRGQGRGRADESPFQEIKDCEGARMPRTPLAGDRPC